MGGTVVAKSKTQSKNYVNAFASAVAALSRAGEDITARVLEMLVSDFDAARAELWLWDNSSGSCYITHAEGLKATHRLDYAAAGSGAVGKIAHNKTTIENIVLSTFGGDDQEFARATGLSHISGYPLLAAGQLAGVLAIYTTGEVPEDLLLWWRLYSEMSAAKLNNVLATQEKDKRINQLSLLFEATRLLNSTLDLAELLELILKIARTEVKAERGTVFLVDQYRKELWSIAASGLDHQEVRIPFGKGIAGQVAVSGELVNTDDAYALPSFDRTFDQRLNYRTKSLLILPIRHHSGEIVGVLQLLNAQSGNERSLPGREPGIFDRRQAPQLLVAPHRRGRDRRHVRGSRHLVREVPADDPVHGAADLVEQGGAGRDRPVLAATHRRHLLQHVPGDAGHDHLPVARQLGADQGRRDPRRCQQDRRARSGQQRAYRRPVDREDHRLEHHGEHGPVGDLPGVRRHAHLHRPERRQAARLDQGARGGPPLHRALLHRVQDGERGLLPLGGHRGHFRRRGLSSGIDLDRHPVQVVPADHDLEADASGRGSNLHIAARQAGRIR